MDGRCKLTLILILQVDKDESGTIDLPEFIALVARKQVNVDPEEELLDAFKTLDRKKFGKISTTELKHFVT